MGATQPLVIQIVEQVETIQSHVTSLEKVASETTPVNNQVLDSLGNLRVCLESLGNAIGENRLETAPALVLSELVKDTTAVAGSIANAVGNIAGQGGVFTNNVNALHRQLWVDRLIDPAAEVRAHQAAAGKLDATMAIVRDNIAKLEDGITLRDQVAAAAAAAASLQAQAGEATTAAESDKARLEALLTEANAMRDTFSASANAIEALHVDSVDRNTQVKTLEADLKKWHGEVNATLQSIEAVRNSMSTTVGEYKADMATRQSDLDDIKVRIDEQFRLVSSGALAQAFSRRNRELFWTKWAWTGVAVLSYGGFALAAIWQTHEMLKDTASFTWVELALRLVGAIPIGLLLWFVTVQFGRARGIQESYAFKETVASSFDAYSGLVEKITKDPELKDNPGYADFIRQTIAGLYKEPPMGKEEDDHPPHTRAFKDATTMFKEVVDGIEKIRKG